MKIPSKFLRTALVSLVCSTALVLSACGGGGGGSSNSNNNNSNTTNNGGGGSSVVISNGNPNATSTITLTGANVVPVSVEQGPSASFANIPFVTVTVCTAGSATCDVIDHVMVDTASTGLRIMSPMLVNSLASMGRQTTIGGAYINECATFASGYTWGTVRLADVTMGQEKVSNLPIHVISDSAAGSVPSDCSSAGSGISMGTVAALGANGILGVQGFRQDCGNNCATFAITGAYYNCNANGSTCVNGQVALGKQVQNPVSYLATDNTGVILELPVISDAGALSATGSLVLGVGTQTNNALGQAVKISTNGGFAFSATYNNASSRAFVDSGSNFLFFDDSTIPFCTGAGLTTYYCPTTTLSKTATFTSTVDASQTYPASFSVANANARIVGTGFYAFNDVGATLGAGGATLGMDFGLPFFFGKNVFVGMETSAGAANGYVAFISNINPS